MSDTLLWYTTRGAGAVTTLLLTGVVVLGVLSALRFDSRGWPRFLTAGMHRNLALLAIAFLAVHVVTAIVDPFAKLGWNTAVVPFSSSYRTLWLGLGTIAAELMIAVVATSLLRRVLGHRAWRGVHWLAYASWPVAIAHGLGTGTDAGSEWLRGIDLVCVVAVGAAVAARLVKGPRDPLAVARARLATGIRRPARP